MNRTNTLPARVILTCFGLGYLRPAPGTWGSLPPVVVGAVLLALGVDGFFITGFMLMVAGGATLACAALGDRAEEAFGKKDPGKVVMDETAGQAIALCFLPACGDLIDAALTAGVAFLTFRFFDITKLWPAGRVQSVPGGWGIVLDDLAAGVQALVVMQVVTRVIWA